MKIRTMWVWGFAIVIGFLFAFVLMPNQLESVDRVDHDIGICSVLDMEEITVIIDNTLIAQKIEICESFKNDVEVEISPGDNFGLVSSTTYIKNKELDMLAGNETLQGSFMIINLENKAHFDYTFNRFVNSNIDSFNNSKQPTLSKDYFRLDRSRCLISGGYIG